MKIPVAVEPFGTVRETTDGNACSMGVSEPLGGGGGGVAGGGGVVEGGGGGVVDGGGGGVVEGGGGGEVVPVAVIVRDTGMRRVCDPLGPLSLM